MFSGPPARVSIKAQVFEPQQKDESLHALGRALSGLLHLCTVIAKASANSGLKIETTIPYPRGKDPSRPRSPAVVVEEHPAAKKSIALMSTTRNCGMLPAESLCVRVSIRRSQLSDLPAAESEALRSSSLTTDTTITASSGMSRSHHML